MSNDVIGCCDLVMKGGVTSGVVYPLAIKEISRKFHLVGIGGTSAGAIAASLAAAAEYRRRHTQSFDGFDMLDAVVRELTRPERLLSLFRPDKNTEKLFELALSFVQGKASLLTKAKLLWKLRSKRSRHRLFAPLAANGFGACSGMAWGNEGGEPALTAWLSDLIDRVAGKEHGHLTFRDLHEAPLPAGFESDFTGETRSIDFRAVTTSITFNRPFEFPLQTRILAFDPDEWRRLFPQSVVDQIVASAEAIPSQQLTRDGKLPLPNLDLPVIVAARMSLSFPLLFSAVPLWAVNYHKDGEPLECVWFSDGGITSNFPVHRFDSIYPRWPTLALNFQATDDNGLPQRKALKDSGELVYMNSERRDGVLDLWSEFTRDDDALGSILHFFLAIFDSAQNWHDNAFLRLPGFRDRIAEIWLKPDEGGLNLEMAADQIQTLITRGVEAGQRLTDRYAELDASEEMSWTGHQWTRFRSGMAGLTEAIEAFGESLGEGSLDGSELASLLASKDAPPCYKFQSDTQRESALELTKALESLAKKLGDRQPFDKGPRPPIEFGSRAPI
jgi:predicted acylesterase/phospholipase RssA